MIDDYYYCFYTIVLCLLNSLVFDLIQIYLKMVGLCVFWERCTHDHLWLSAWASFLYCLVHILMMQWDTYHKQMKLHVLPYLWQCISVTQFLFCCLITAFEGKQVCVKVCVCVQVYQISRRVHWSVDSIDLSFRQKKILISQW